MSHVSAVRISAESLRRHDRQFHSYHIRNTLILTAPIQLHSLHVLYYNTAQLRTTTMSRQVNQPSNPSIPHLPLPLNTNQTPQSIISHYTRLLSLWPKDALRPEKTFSSIILQPRLTSAPTSNPSGVSSQTLSYPGSTSTYQRDERGEVNTAYLLLEGKFSKQFPPGKRLMEPESNPRHYVELGRELEELPNRSVLGNFMQRVRGMVRLK